MWNSLKRIPTAIKVGFPLYMLIMALLIGLPFLPLPAAAAAAVLLTTHIIAVTIATTLLLVGTGLAIYGGIQYFSLWQAHRALEKTMNDLQNPERRHLLAQHKNASSAALVAASLQQTPQDRMQASISQQPAHTTENRNFGYFAKIAGFFSGFFSRSANQNARPSITPADVPTYTK